MGLRWRALDMWRDVDCGPGEEAHRFEGVGDGDR